MRKATLARKVVIYGLLIVILSNGACKKINNPDVSASSISVSVKYDDSYGIKNIKDISVSIKNGQTGKVYTQKTNEAGVVAFQNIPAGLYDVSSIVEMTAKEYMAITGLIATENVIFTAAKVSVQLKPGENTIQLVLKNSSNKNGFVIKQIYYGGSNSKKAGGINDQFIEIYNNSSDTLYADSLIITLVEGARQLPPNNLDANFYYQETGSNPYQYDWSKSKNMPLNIDANSYLYGTAYMIPGNGTDYPVLSGKSIIVAQSAKNYKGDFIDMFGRKIKPENPDSTVDLSHANFEYNLGQVSPGWDTDNPNVPDLIIVSRANSRDMILDSYGKEAVAIWKCPGGPQTLPKYGAPKKRAEDEVYAKTQIPPNYIIDAVEIQPSNGVRGPKRIFENLDASYTFTTPFGEHSSHSVVRKTLRTTPNGRKVLQDTNNSLNDFVTIKAEPDAFAN